jgi:hypothetical protein
MIQLESSSGRCGIIATETSNPTKQSRPTALSAGEMLTCETASEAAYVLATVTSKVNAAKPRL